VVGGGELGGPVLGSEQGGAPLDVVREGAQKPVAERGKVGVVRAGQLPGVGGGRLIGMALSAVSASVLTPSRARTQARESARWSARVLPDQSRETGMRRPPMPRAARW
jgi:hypothetical protein